MPLSQRSSQVKGVVQSLSCVWLFETHGLQHTRLPCLHCLPELAQTHVHWVRDAIQPSHPLPSLSPPTFDLSLNHGFFLMRWLFALGGQSIGVSASASVFPMNIQGWFPSRLTHLISLQSMGLSRVFSNTTIHRQFFGTQLSLWSNSYTHTRLLEKP